MSVNQWLRVEPETSSRYSRIRFAGHDKSKYPPASCNSAVFFEADGPSSNVRATDVFPRFTSFLPRGSFLRPLGRPVSDMIFFACTFTSRPLRFNSFAIFVHFSPCSSSSRSRVSSSPGLQHDLPEGESRNEQRWDELLSSKRIRSISLRCSADLIRKKLFIKS